jgi:iron-sulfur cluster repair protein YtfE (RIC family)
MDDALKLETRTGLPDALRVLLDEMPRMGWEQHPDFPGLARFWLERHMMFRRIVAALGADAEKRLDNTVSADWLAQRVSRFGGMLLGGLQEHHNIEDTVYFPKMQLLEPRLVRGFDMLDKDHHALDAWLNQFAQAANGVIGSPSRDTTGAFASELQRFGPLLERHLIDEEDLIVPVILRTGLT